MIFGFLTGALWTFKIVAWLWLIVTVLDFVIPGDIHNLTAKQASDLTNSLIWRLAIWLWVPVRAAVIGCGLSIMTWESATFEEIVVVTVSVGITSGMFCVAVAHELMHGQARFEKALAEILMTTVSYAHFCIEHVHGHHLNVGTGMDPATARLGENFYEFYSRTVFGGVVDAWTLETARLRHISVPAWSYRNRMLRYFTWLVVTYIAIIYVAGLLGLAFFVVQSVIGFSMLEVINYVQHYGLVRREVEPGRYEKVMPWHSWNSSHRASNWLLFNLGYHSNHHHEVTRRYQLLRHLDEAPQLPTGYFGIFLLPLFPPLWYRIMDPRIHAWRRKHGVAAEVFCSSP
jgi:alkane 1-monooxygenase